MKLSTFGLVESNAQISTNGAEHVSVPFLDFTIDGTPLLDSLPLGTEEATLSNPLVSQIQNAWPIESTECITRLLLELPPDLPDGRTSLYVCPACFDLGCGAITALIEQDEWSVVWREFGWQTDYHTGYEPLSQLPRPLDVRFERRSYEATLRGRLEGALTASIDFEYPRDRDRRLRRERRRARLQSWLPWETR